MIFGVIAFLAPFSHIFIDRVIDPELEKAIGFRSVYHMMYSLGFPILGVYISILFFFLSKHIKDRKIKIFSNVIGVTCLSTSLFFIIWGFFPRVLDNWDYPKLWYRVFSFVIAIILTYAFYWLYQFFTSEESRFVKTINYILYNRAKTVIPLVKEEDQSKRAEIAIENDEKLKETLDEVF